MADDTVIYSKRYPQEREKIRALWDQFKESEGGKEETERKLREFWEKMETESVYIPIPGWENKSKCFIALAKKMSQIYELDIDIRRRSYSIEAALHLYCAAYPSEMTRQLAELFAMCDKCCSFLLVNEPIDFTLSLELYTHHYYLGGSLVND